MNLFSYLKTRITILDVVNEYTTLKKTGLYWKGACPFHSEKTASFTVSPHKEIFYCFGCQAGGDVIAFIARMENCSQKEAAHQLIERYRIEIPQTLSSNLQDKNDQRARYHHICQQVSNWCHEQLLRSADALEYLKERGITKESITYFKLGYFPGGMSTIKKFVQHFANHTILVEDLIENHIISRSKNILFSPFEERIIFPICDHLGNVCGFGGRIFKTSDTRPKYYNSGENEYFTKGHLLFGLEKAKKEIQKSNAVFLVEGYTDCILMAHYGYANTVATLGTACTLEHLTLLSRYCQQLYLAYDGDNAGQQAILRIGQLCWQANLELKVICLPPEHDPATFLVKNKALEPLIKDAKDIFAFFIETVGSDFTKKSLPQKLQITRKILEIIQTLDDPLKQDLLLQNAATQLTIPFDSLKQELQRLAHATKEIKPVEVPTPEAPLALAPTNTSSLENKIFLSIMNNIQLINKENTEFLTTYLPLPLCDILKKLQEEKQKNPTLGFIQFFELLNSRDQHFVSKAILATQEEISSGLFEQLLNQLQKRQWKMIVNSIKIKLQVAKQKGDEVEIATLMQAFSDLKKKIVKNMLPE